MSSDPNRPGQSASSLEDIRAARLQKIEDLKQLGLNPFAYRWDVTHRAADLQENTLS